MQKSEDIGSFFPAFYLGAIVEVLGRSSWLKIVVVSCVAHLLYRLAKNWGEYRADLAFGNAHGCSPPPQLPNRWPLGVDRLKELWESNSEGRLLAFLCGLADGYEPRNNLCQYMLFGPRVFHTLHPKNVEAILSSSFRDFGFGVRRGVFYPLLGDGIFTQEGSAWKHSRELLRKQFVRTQYKNSDHFREYVDNFLDCLPDSKGVVDLQPLFFKLTLDTTTALLFGQSVNSLQQDAITDAADTAEVSFAESFNTAQDGLAKRFRIAPWHSFYNPPEFRRACTDVHNFVDNYIKTREFKPANDTHDQANFSFIDQVASESSNKTMLRDQLINVLLAGRDTTACCLSWTILNGQNSRLLVRHAPVLDLLRSEINAIIGDSNHPTREQIQKMPYMRNVIRESLRLYPPVPLNNRTALKTTMLPTGGGPDGESPILVRRGEVVIYSSYVNSRRKNIYGPDADEFVPDRWDRPELADIGWAYFPFSGGPRICLGQDFALMEVAYTTVRLLQAYPRISLPVGEKNEPIGTEKQRLTLVLSSADGCKVELDRASIQVRMKNRTFGHC